MTDEELIENFRKFFLYVDGELFWKESPAKRIRKGDVAGTIKTTGYKCVGFGGKKYMVHRVIFSMFKNYFPEYVDHIDGDKLNNRLENLRECTARQNLQNSRLSIKNTSGVKGVCRFRNKWMSYIKNEKGVAYLGTFTSIMEAESVVKTARLKYHGEFARHQ